MEEMLLLGSGLGDLRLKKEVRRRGKGKSEEGRPQRRAREGRARRTADMASLSRMFSVSDSRRCPLKHKSISIHLR